METAKRAALEREYAELLKESEKMAQELRTLNEAKKRLQAEISFLKRRAKLIKDCDRTTEGIKEYFSARESSPELPSNINTLVVCKGLPLKPRLPQKLGGVHPQCQVVIGKPSQSRTSHQTTLASHELVGVLKLPKYGLQESKKSGKRKISWQDESRIKV